MKKHICTLFQFRNHIVLLAWVAMLSACGSSSPNTATTASSLSSVSSSGLTISPSTITVGVGGSYPFTTSGGSGTYTYSVLSGSGSIGYYTGYYTAPSGWTGTANIEVTDSIGNVGYATVTVTSSSTTTTTTTSTSSVTGTLTHCAGIIGGYSYLNNWEVNGTELRSINDYNYAARSPINCTGLNLTGSIPSNATIQGVSVSIFLINQTSFYDGGYLLYMNLINSNAMIGSAISLNQAIPGNTATFPTFTQGASGNNWGASLTPSIVNSSSFGVSIQTYRGMDRLFLGQSSTVAPQVTIYYSI